MAGSLLEFLPNLTFVFAEGRPVVVVELLDDLKRPSAEEHVAADQLALQPVGDSVVTGVAQLVACFTEHQVGVAHQLMKRVQMASRTFDVLQCFRYGACRLHRLVADPVRTAFEVVSRLR
jgi:hypothetical protein